MPKPTPRPAHYVELEHKYGLAALFCPVCGHCIVRQDEGLESELCPHVLFVHDWVGEFLTRDEAIQELVDAALDEAEEADANAIELLRAKFDRNVVFFESFEPAFGPKDAAAITVVVDMGAAGVQQQ